MTNKELQEKTAKELQQDPKLVEFVIKHFWDSFRYYITHPELSKKGILINTFLKFKLRKKFIQEKTDQMENNFYKTPGQEMKLKVHKTILQNLENLTKCQDNQASKEEKNQQEKPQ